MPESDGLEDRTLDEIAEMAEAYYPGSNKRRGSVAPTVEVESINDWDASPKVYVVQGVEVEFFTIGALAKALSRKPVTIRMWEANGIIPMARFRSPGPAGKQRRLYSRAQVEGIVRIAKEEGIDKPNRQVATAGTQFTERVIRLFEEV